MYQERAVHGMQQEALITPDLPDSKKKFNTKIESLILLPRKGRLINQLCIPSIGSVYS